MSNGHTYDKWQELGYQVKRGESAAYKYYGNNVFTRDQVVPVSNHYDDDYDYANHCWNCKSDVDSDSNYQCRRCSWLKCDCGSCGCDYHD